MDRRQSEVQRCWRQHQCPLPVAIRTAEMRDEYDDLASTPTFLVTDRQSVVRERRKGMVAAGELERLVTGLL